MKKFGIMVIALCLLIVGMAVALPSCPFVFAPADDPLGFTDELGVADMGYTMEIGGICVGSVMMSESAGMQTGEGLCSSKVGSLNLMATNAEVQLAHTATGSQSGFDTSVGSSTAISYDKPYFGGMLTGNEGIYSFMAADAGGDSNSTAGANPYYEQVSSKIDYALTSGAIATQSYASSTVMPNMPHNVKMVAGVTGANGKEFAQGTVSMQAKIMAIQGVKRTVTDEATNTTSTHNVPISMTDYTSRTRFSGSMSTAYNFNFDNTHGTMVPAGFPYNKVVVGLC